MPKVHEDGAGGCVVKGRCYKSMKKNDMPHEMQINLVDGPILQSGTCSCPIGNLGTCGHVTGLLYTLAHMQSLKMKSIPSDVLKTSLPQTWHIPRGEKLSGSVSDDVVLCGYDPQSPYRQPRGLRSTIYNPIRSDLPPTSELLDAVREIESNCLLLTVVSDGDPNMTETKFGKYPKGSPLSYQQKLSSHYLMNIMDGEFPSLPVENVMENTLNVVLDQRKTTQLNSLNISPQECVQIEEMTRLQSTDPRWHAVRRDRLTASVAGEIVKRRADNDPLVARLKSTRRVVTESMRHGLLFEAIAANSYAMLNEQNVNIYPCGIIVSPHSPWLAASPDRKVYHSQMVPSYGLLEIKCPVKPLAECQYLVKDGDANWVLKKNHNYYYQIMMQLAVSGLKWCHFYVWREDEHHLECVTYNEEFWKEMKLKLDLFYFYHYLD